MKKIFTEVPNSKNIELVEFYDKFIWYYRQCELSTKKWCVSNVKKDWVIFDCGSNIGYYSILFSNLAPFGHIYSFEPTKTVDMLIENINFNNSKNITVVNSALGATSGLRKEKIYRVWGLPPEIIECEFITIDNFISKNKIQKLDCIKIDVDSFDFDVLRGAVKTLNAFNPWIIIEINDSLALRGESTMKVLSWLNSIGYDNALVLDNDNFVLKRSILSKYFKKNSFSLKIEPLIKGDNLINPAYPEFGVAENFQKKINFIICREEPVNIFLIGFAEELGVVQNIFNAYLTSYSLHSFDSIQLALDNLAVLNLGMDSICAFVFESPSALKKSISILNEVSNLNRIGMDSVEGILSPLNFLVCEVVQDAQV